MTDSENPIGERVAAVETDIKHVLDGLVRIEGSVARIENVVIKEAASRLETRIGRVDRRLTETKNELKSDIARVKGVRRDRGGVPIDDPVLSAAVSENRRALFVLCGTVVVGVVAVLLKGSFF
ncbi:MAG: hypothetical protein OXH09_21845 [Gammaproteobacteria bacterium]|nr:hypothetical protein [Gammaproteobacteria bacterium]